MGLALTTQELDFYREEIEEEFNTFVDHPWFAARQGAKQWRFFKHCFDVLMRRQSGDFNCGEKEAVNYKFEIKAKLQKYYLSFGKPIHFLFLLESVKKGLWIEHAGPNYPSCNGYYLRVLYNKSSPDEIQLQKLLIEKTITRAIEAEFQAYEALPEIKTKVLEKYYETGSSAYITILEILIAHRDRRWIITNPQNPSTIRLADLQIKEISEDRAVVRTKEYWLLKWWGVEQKKYAHTYNETNWQTYFLKRRKKNWVITDNPYPKPKTSTPRRNIRKFQGR